MGRTLSLQELREREFTTRKGAGFSIEEGPQRRSRRQEEVLEDADFSQVSSYRFEETAAFRALCVLREMDAGDVRYYARKLAAGDPEKFMDILDAVGVL